MGEARQLLRKLWSHTHLPCPAFSSRYQHFSTYRQFPQVLYLHSSDDTDEEYKRVPQGMSSSVFSTSGSVDCARFLAGASRVTFPPEHRRHAEDMDGTSSKATSLAHRYYVLPSGSLAGSLISQMRSVSISNFLRHGHTPLQPLSMVRYSSTAAGEQLEDELGNVGGVGGSPEVFNAVNVDIAEKLATPEVQAVSEVSAIIGDCSYPTAFLQLLMENVHVHVGLPWWAAIVVTTIGIRILCIPATVYQLRAAARLSNMRPEMEKINEEIKASNNDPEIFMKARERITELFAKHKTTPFAPFLGVVLQAPIFISFFFALQNMVQNLGSFKKGGFLWFTDLSTVDSTYILPVVLTASYLLTIELNAAEGMEGNPLADEIKNFMRFFAIALLPISMNFEKALFCYWLTSTYFSLLQYAVLKIPAVKEYLDIPSTTHLASKSQPVTPSTTHLASESQPVTPASEPALEERRTRYMERRKAKKLSKKII